MTTVISILAMLIESFTWVYGILVLGDAKPDIVFIFSSIVGIVLMLIAILIDMKDIREKEKRRNHKNSRNA